MSSRTRRVIPLIALMFLLPFAPVFAQDLATRLKEHYVGKVVMAKVPLPENSPLIMYPEREDRFDNELLRLKLDRAGIGLEPGMFAVIKSIELDGREIDVRLVGVGYDLPGQRIADDLLDAKILQQGSARIRILPKTALADVSDPIGTLNGWLADLVSIRTLASDNDLPEEIRAAIATKNVIAGMNHKAVYLVMGEPTAVLRELRVGRLEEAWLYEREDFSTLMVFFVDGRVELIKEF